MDWQNAKDILVNIVEEQRLGLISDVDGTLSPIVDRPEDAIVTPQNQKLLAELQAILPLTAVISGRSAEDIYHRVGIDGLVAIGNHGMEIWQNGGAYPLPEVGGYRPALEDALSAVKKVSINGLLLEDKRVTFSVHYRQTEQPERIHAKLAPVLQNIADDYGLRLTQGRMVFEFRPPVDVDKGTAFKSLVIEYQLTAALYLGDDTTDIAALQAARSLREKKQCLSYGIAVDSRETSNAVLAAADFTAQGVDGVEAFLDWLSKVTMASST